MILNWFPWDSKLNKIIKPNLHFQAFLQQNYFKSFFIRKKIPMTVDYFFAKKETFCENNFSGVKDFCLERRRLKLLTKLSTLAPRLLTP